MRTANNALLCIAAGDHPLTAENIDDLKNEACLMARFANDCGFYDPFRVQMIAAVRRLISRLDPADATVEGLVGWLERVDPRPAEQLPAAPAIATPARAEPVAEPETGLDAETAKREIEKTRADIAAAERVASELGADLEGKVAARESAKKSAIATRTWGDYHAADRAVIEAEMQAAAAAEALASLRQRLLDVDRGEKLGRYRAALEAASEAYLVRQLDAAADAHNTIEHATKVRTQIINAAAMAQHQARLATLHIGRELGLSQQEVFRDAGLHFNYDLTQESVAHVGAIVARLAMERGPAGR